MPSIDGFTKILSGVYKNCKVLSGDSMKLVKKSPFVESTMDVLTKSPFSVNNCIRDKSGRFLYINTTVCADNIRVYKLSNDSNISTVTYFDKSGKRVLKEIWDKTGSKKLKVIAYDENGLKPMEVPDMIKRFINIRVKRADMNLPLEF